MSNVELSRGKDPFVPELPFLTTFPLDVLGPTSSSTYPTIKWEVTEMYQLVDDKVYLPMSSNLMKFNLMNLTGWTPHFYLCLRHHLQQTSVKPSPQRRHPETESLLIL